VTAMEITIEPNDTSTDTLPAVLTGAQITEARLQEIDSWKNYVVADPLDEAGAREADRLRLLAKADRCTTVRICDDERDSALRQNKWWIAVKKRVSDRIGAVEDHLQAIVDAHKGAVAAKKQAKTQTRLDALTARGIAPNLAQAQTLTDEAWEKWLELETEQASIRARAQDVADRLTALGDPCVYVEALALSEEEQRIRLEAAAHADLLRKDAEKLAKELTELGDPCTTEEALVLPAEAAVQRLRDAREDKKRLDEEARIALGQSRRDALLDEDPEILIDGRPLPTPDDLAALNPADWAEKLGNVKRAVEERGRRRLQLGADRMAVLAGLGMEGIPTQTQLCVLTDESFETIRALAADAKVTRDRLADEQRAEMDRLREVERLAKVALESTRRGILDSIWPGWWAEEESYGRVPLCDLDERRFQGCADRCRREKEQKNTQEREDVEREARARPEREKLAAWGREVMIAIPEVPEVKDPRNVAILANATTGIQNALRAMRDALGDVTGE